MKMESINSRVEQYFFQQFPANFFTENSFNFKTIIVDNYVVLGQLTALRFLEWVCLNPKGVIALPTGKTPEFFIKWVQYYLSQWEKEIHNGLLKKIGFDTLPIPDMSSLHFFQLDEFFPIKPDHERSFSYFIQKFYIQGFGLNPENVHLIDTYHLPEYLKQTTGYQNTYQVFSDDYVDLSLRSRKASSEKEHIQKEVLTYYDDFCQQYEKKIRDFGGIGFFLGGIGPDGHIAFNIRGSSHYSHTRLTEINYETQAAAATDLGGIELVRKKEVITIGLSTITFNPDVTAIIIAAGQSKATIIADALHQKPSVLFPATALHKLPNARFYITLSTTKHLQLSEKTLFHINKEKLTYPSYINQLLLEELKNSTTSLYELTNTKIINEKKIALEKVEKILQKPIQVIAKELFDELDKKIQKGINIPKNQRILHTAPHHDDIELAYFPLLHHLVRSEFNENYFVYCTSGFTAVTNQYLLNCLNDALKILTNNIYITHSIWKKIHRPEASYEDITGYLNGIAQQNRELQNLFLCSRLIRQLMHKFKKRDIQLLVPILSQLIDELKNIEPGRKEAEIFYLLKGWLREFEAELVWAHFGIDSDKVFHLRLPFYSDDIFPQYPDFEKDVNPILAILEKLRPTVVTLAFDPEGSGPDTHYKTLIALAEAIDIYVKNNPSLPLTIWGYRNIWSRFEIYECNKIFPTSLNSFAVLHNMFNNCFLSQRSASFPSFEHDGPFSELAQKIWVEQFQLLKQLLGEDYFYKSTHPMLRRAYGAIFLKEMTYDTFQDEMKAVRRLLKLKDSM